MFRTGSLLRTTIAHTTHRTRTLERNTPTRRLKVRLSEVKVDYQLHRQLTAIFNDEGKHVLAYGKDMAQQARCHGYTTDNPAAREAAEAETVLVALYEACRLLEKYEVRGTHTEIMQCVSDGHLFGTRNEFLCSFLSLTRDEQVKVGAALEPGLLEKVGISPGGNLSRAIEARRTTRPPGTQLNEGEWLAVTDYVSSQSGVFNALNGAGRAAAYYHVPLFKEIFDFLDRSLDQGIRKLGKNGDFAAPPGTLIYKGLHLYGSSGPFRRACLEDGARNGSLIVFPHALSGTTEQKKSYAYAKSEKGYEYELAIELNEGEGVDVDCFHDLHSKGEKEVLVRAHTRYRIKEKYHYMAPNFDSTGGQIPINGYRLTPADE